MQLQKLKVGFLFLVCSIFIIAGCSSEETDADGEEASNDTESEAGEELSIVTSFSVLADIIEEVAGDRATVDYIVPIGEEPHEYEPVPSNFSTVSDADVFYVNGLSLEEWLEKIVSNVSETDIVELSNGVEPINLVGEDEPDPHAWLSPKNTKMYVENLVEDLVERDPGGEEVYRAGGEAYIEQLNELDAWIEEEVSNIPEDHRVIIVSENAFKYYGESYGFRTEGIWEINSHEEGTPQQINRIIDILEDEGIPSVFLESTVPPSFMENVSSDAGVPIAGEVYTDAIGEEGSGAESYIEMIRHNTKTFVDGLSSN